MSSELSLYGAASELEQIESILERMDNPEEQELLAQRTNDLIEFIKEKTDNACYFNQSLDDHMDAIDLRIKELQQVKKSIESKQANYHRYVLSAMDKLEMKKVSGKLYTISYRTPTKVVEVINENDLDPEFLRTTIPEPITEVDKKAIKEAIQNNRAVSGAILKDGKRSLSFKASSK